MKKAILLMALVSGLFANEKDELNCEKTVIESIKWQMYDADSFKLVDFISRNIKGENIGAITYKGSNAYGGIVTKEVVFDFDVVNGECKITNAVEVR